MNESTWTNRQVVAWTDHDGPGRPPAGPSRPLSTAVAWTLVAVFVGIMFTDTLCPEHRAWVQALASVALVGTVVAVVGLLRDWPSAPLVTLASAGCGVAIGVIDAVHAPVRGSLVAGAFGVVALLASALSLRSLRLARWERGVLAGLAPVEAPNGQEGTEARPEATPEVPATAPATSDAPSTDATGPVSPRV